MAINFLPNQLYESITTLQESLFVLETFEQKVYDLLKDHPLELLLHVSLVLVTATIDLLSHLLELLKSTLTPENL